MRIIINGLEAVLKSGASFDYVTENRYFTGADAYTMAITFPVAGCERNQKIFGNINRKDILNRDLLLDCDIYAKNFHKKGSITVTEITDKDIKCQFLEGRSVDNFYSSLDEVFINELDLGGYFTVYKEYIKPGDAFRLNSEIYQIVPWCNNTSGIVHNGAVFNRNDKDGKWWDYKNNVEDNSGSLSFMPYLRWIFKRICEAVGYTNNTAEWDQTKWKDLLICNVVPESWENDRWSFILPHWTVSQFFEECENLMNCQINVDHVSKEVTVKFYNDIITKDNIIKLDNVVKEYTSEITDNDESEYNESSIIKYAECSNGMWPLYTMDWEEDLINSKMIKSVTYGSMDNIRNLFLENGGTWFLDILRGKLFRDDETRSLWARKVIEREPDNLNPGTGWDHVVIDPVTIGNFKPSQADKGQKEVELSIVPVWLDYIDRRENGVLMRSEKVVFMECGELHNETDMTEEVRKNNQSMEFNLVKSGKKEATAVFDKIYVGFYNNDIFDKFKFSMQGESSYNTDLPHPLIEKVNTLLISSYYTYFIDEFSLELNGNGMRKSTGIQINQYEKFNIKFIANEIPDVYSIFLIEGNKFLCKKITATFTQEGMSQLLKGEFYKITN